MRFGDARALHDANNNARNNGTIYLAGYVIEILLKAALLERHPWLAQGRSLEGLSEEKRRVSRLFYQSHALDELADAVPDFYREMDKRGLGRSFAHACYLWSVFLRYSSVQSRRDESARFLEVVGEIRKCF